MLSNSHHKNFWRACLLLYILLQPWLLPLTMFGTSQAELYTFAEFEHLLISIVSTFVSIGWFGLVAYLVLRRPQFSHFRIAFAILAYWGVIAFAVDGLSSLAFRWFEFRYVTFFVFHFLLGGATGCLFLTMARSSRLQLLAQNEKNEGTGLDLKTTMITVSVVGILLTGVQAAVVWVESVYSYELPIVVMLIQLLLVSLTSTTMLTLVFLLQNKQQWIIGGLLLIALLSINIGWNVYESFRLEEANNRPHHLVLIITETVFGMVTTGVAIGALVLLRKAWAELGLTIRANDDTQESTGFTSSDAGATTGQMLSGQKSRAANEP